uniref:Uncharacterized protein n=1 Tax=Meloidogyne enterolobii TaxID=390850 RepID=A0A6V7UZW6_MELEN|nr:unnamed protein product [Meloidogyne enterolobii]
MMHNVLTSLLFLFAAIFGTFILLAQCAKKSDAKANKKDKKGKKNPKTVDGKKQKKDTKAAKDNTKLLNKSPSKGNPKSAGKTKSGKFGPKTITVVTAEEYAKDELTELLARAVKPDPETMNQLKKMKIDNKRKPVMIPPKQQGGTATVILMPPRDMQSTLLVTAMPDPAPNKKKDEPKVDEEFSVEVSKRKDMDEGDSKKGEGMSISLE